MSFTDICAICLLFAITRCEIKQQVQDTESKLVSKIVTECKR